MAEPTLFSEGPVQVTRRRLVVDDQAYALGDITAVQIGTRPMAWLARLCLVAGAIALLGAQLSSNLTWWVAALVLLGIAGYGWWRSRHTYILVLGTPAGNKNAMVSTNRQLIDRVAQAIDGVLVARGGRGL